MVTRVAATAYSPPQEMAAPAAEEPAAKRVKIEPYVIAQVPGTAEQWQQLLILFLTRYRQADGSYQRPYIRGIAAGLRLCRHFEDAPPLAEFRSFAIAYLNQLGLAHLGDVEVEKSSLPKCVPEEVTQENSANSLCVTINTMAVQLNEEQDALAVILFEVAFVMNMHLNAMPPDHFLPPHFMPNGVEGSGTSCLSSQTHMAVVIQAVFATNPFERNAPLYLRDQKMSEALTARMHQWKGGAPHPSKNFAWNLRKALLNSLDPAIQERHDTVAGLLRAFNLSLHLSHFYFEQMSGPINLAGWYAQNGHSISGSADMRGVFFHSNRKAPIVPCDELSIGKARFIIFCKASEHYALLTRDAQNRWHLFDPTGTPQLGEEQIVADDAGQQQITIMVSQTAVYYLPKMVFLGTGSLDGVLGSSPHASMSEISQGFTAALYEQIP